MSIFNEFPYTNFHELNLDWLVKEVKQLISDWAKYKEDWQTLYDETNEAIQEANESIEELRQFVVDYFNNINIGELINEEALKIFDQLIDDGYFDQIARQAILQRTKINTRLLFSKFYQYTDGEAGFPNGACYIGNGKIALYLANEASNIGKLAIIDVDSWSVVSESDLELKHGNSLTFNPNNNKIYSVSLYDYNAISTLLNEVRVVDISDYTNPVIDEVITLPMPGDSTGVYAMAYDPITDQFAATCKSGQTGSVNDGQVNRIVIYNNDLSAIVRTVFIGSDMVIGGQGVQSFYNNMVYINHCDYNYMSIGVYNADTGAVISMYELPEYINGFRYIGEPETFIYDTVKDSWYCVAALYGAGVSGHVGASIFEMGLYKTIPNIKLRPETYNPANSRYVTITVSNGAEGVNTDINTATCLLDAIAVCRNNDIQGDIRIAPGNVDIGTFDIINFNGSIQGGSTYALYANFVGGLRIFNSNVRFAFCNFNGETYNTFIGANTPGNVAVYSSIVNFQAVNFATRLLISDTTMYNALATWVITALRSIITAPAALSNATLTYTSVLTFTT